MFITVSNKKEHGQDYKISVTKELMMFSKLTQISNALTHMEILLIEKILDSHQYASF